MNNPHTSHRRNTAEGPHSSHSNATLNVPSDTSGMAIRCQYCPGQAFRRSRLRPEDFKQILLMRYPVRCLRCSQRQMVSFTVAGISVPSRIMHQRPDSTGDTWQTWTESAHPGNSTKSESKSESDE